MASNPLSPERVLQAMADALPTHAKDDTTSDLSSSAEAIALFTHACMRNLDFRLIGFNEDQKTESECARLAPRLPPNWNASVSSYSFLYAHAQSSMQFIIKVDRLGAKIEIRGLAVGAENINRLELVARDYISPSALPLRITLTSSGDGEDRSDLVSKLQAVAISPTRINDLATLLKINIIQPLIPSLRKEGYQETTNTSQQQQDPDDRQVQDDLNRIGREGPARQPSRPEADLLPPGARADPLRFGPTYPRRPVPDFAPPGFEDEHEIHRPGHLFQPPGGFGGGFGGIGHNDVHPPGFGPMDPLRQSFVPGRQGGLPGYGGGGGMHPTLDDPLFGGPRGDGGGSGGGGLGQAPPGARWDPVGPGAGGRGRGGRGLPDDDGFGPRGFNPGGGGFGPGGSPFGGGDII